MVDTTTGSLMMAVANVSWLEGLLTCRPLKKRRPKESFGFGDLLARLRSGVSAGTDCMRLSPRVSSADFSDTRRLNSRFSLFMPFDPEGTRGRSGTGSSGDLLNTRVSITVIVAGGGVSDSLRCGDGAVYCSKCGDGGRAGRRGFQPGEFLETSNGASYSIRDIVLSEIGIGDVPSGADRGVNFG